MDLYSDYLANRTLSGKLFADIPAEDTGIIVIIPAFNEPGIIFTLESLLQCRKPPCKTELIVLVNAPPGSSERQIEQNRITCSELADWKAENENAGIRLLYHDAGVQKTRWGVGMARKMAMDEALRRFHYLGRPCGVIVSLDADCLVSENYLEEIYRRLYLQKDRKACSMYFEHPLSGDLPQQLYDSIAEYELHLRYYYQAMRYTGFPGAFHTIGSAIAVKAETYLRAGGMNKRQGAEDFYFIQKIIPSGGYFSLNTVTVMPSPRISDRVPFGTGPVMAEMVKKGEAYLTYKPEAFEGLKTFFANLDSFYGNDKTGLEEQYQKLRPGLREFLDVNNWPDRLSEIRKNTSSLASFRKRFFNWFNMFRIVKYLNFVHRDPYFEKIPVRNAASYLLAQTAGIHTQSGVKELLEVYRQMER